MLKNEVPDFRIEEILKPVMIHAECTTELLNDAMSDTTKDDSSK